MSKDTKNLKDKMTRLDPKNEEKEQFESALQDLNLAASKLKVKGGLKIHGMAETPYNN